MCPFKANDSSAVSLAASSQSLIQGLLDNKNNCSQSFQQAIRSVEGLPQLIESARDPIGELTAELEAVSAEIGRVLTDQARSTEGSAGSIAGQAYIDELFARRQELQRLIMRKRAESGFHEKEKNREKLLALTMNLISVTGGEFVNPESTCAKNVGGRYGSQILSVGLGALSTTGKVLATGLSGGAALGAILVSQLVDMFSRLPDGKLREFQQDTQTLDLACLYLNVVQQSCSMKDRGSGSQVPPLRAEAEKIPGFQHLAKVAASTESQSAISNLVSAIISQEVTTAVGGAGQSDVEKAIGDIRASMNVTVAPRDSVESAKRNFLVAKKYYVDSPALFATLKQHERASLKDIAEMTIRAVRSDLEAQGIQTGDMMSGQSISPIDLIKQHHPKIAAAFEQKLKEISEDSGGDLNFKNLEALHRGINHTDTLLRIDRMLKAAEASEQYLREMKLDRTSDAVALKAMNDRQRKMLTSLKTWVEVEQGEASVFQKKLGEATMALRGSVDTKATTSSQLIETAKYSLSSPSLKFQQIMETKAPDSNDPLLIDSLRAPSQAINPFAKVKALRELIAASNPSVVPLEDQSLIARTRTLFEASGSTLRNYLSDGIEGWVDRINSSSDREVTRRMATQLCGLAFSLPHSSAENSLSSCRNMMPPGMVPATGAKRDSPDCTYVDYLRKQTREEGNRAGQPVNLPSSNRTVK